MLSPDQEGLCVSYQGTLTLFSYPNAIYLDRKSTSKIYKSFLKQFEVTVACAFLLLWKSFTKTKGSYEMSCSAQRSILKTIRRWIGCRYGSYILAV